MLIFGANDLRLIVLASRFLRQAQRYVLTLSWLIRDSVSVAPAQWQRILLATLLNLGSNAAIAAIIYFYVNLLQSDAETTIHGLHIVARESFLLLSLFILGLTAALIAFAASDFIARTSALRLHRNYYAHSRDRVLLLLNRLPDPRNEVAAELVKFKTLRRLITTYTHSAGWSLRFIGNAVPNITILIAGYASLFWLDAETTLVVTLLGLFVVLAQYPVHYKAAAASNTLEALASHFSGKLSALIDYVRRFGGGPGDDLLRAQIDELHRDPRVRRYEDADEQRFRAMEQSALWMQVGGGIILAAMLLTIGSGLLSEQANWAILLVYATFLRRLLVSMTAVFRAVAVFSRFAPGVQTYRSFVVSFDKSASMPERQGGPLREIALKARQIDGPAATLTLHAGHSFSLCAPAGLDRNMAITLQRSLRGDRPSAASPPPSIRPVLHPRPSRTPVNDGWRTRRARISWKRHSRPVAISNRRYCWWTA